MIVAGVGFSSKCGPDELVDLVMWALAAVGQTATALAAPAWRAEAACLKNAALRLDLPILAIDRNELALAADRIITHSFISSIAAGVGSAAEAAALAAAGPGSRLAVARMSSAHATCAIAEGDPL